MPTSKQPKMLSVRLPESDLRRFKSVAATRGVSLQEAVHEALEFWAAQIPNPGLEPLDRLQASLADVDVEQLMLDDRSAELAHDAALLENPCER